MHNPLQLLLSPVLPNLAPMERTALLFILESLKPKACIYRGMENGEFLPLLSRYSQKVCTVDSSYDEKEIQLVLIDRENYRVKYDLEAIFKIRPRQPIYILIYNSFHPECRKGILEADWHGCRYVHSIEIDYVPGTFHEHDEYHKQMRGGFALAILLPEARIPPLTIAQSNRLVYDTVYRQSIHLEPFHPDKILMDISWDVLLKKIKGKKIVFFGTGAASQRMLENFPLPVHYYVDNDYNKWGTHLHNLMICNPATLLQEDKDALAIIIASQYAQEILDQLVKMGFEENVHCWNGYWLFNMHRSLTQGYFVDKYKKADLSSNLSWKISVIVPNYNYSLYLSERLYSIIHQTVQPFEIIFLDDASTDDSVTVAQKLLKESNIPYRIIANETNQGCFNQWIKGIQMAQGDIIWVAEADDVCRLDFLEEAIVPFSDLEVTVSYVQSKAIDNKSQVMDLDYVQYTDDLSRTKWKTDYCQNGQDEIIQGLAVKNTIPNASGVLIRKSSLRGIEKELRDFSICGDWFTYVYALRQGKIAFTAKILNYHRRHEISIISKRLCSTQYFKELWQIKRYIADHFLLTAAIHDRFLNQVQDEFRHLDATQLRSLDMKLLNQCKQQVVELVEGQNSRIRFLTQRKCILFVILHLEIGGAEIVPIRLANYLAAFHDVYLYVANPQHGNEQVKKMISPNVYQLPSNGHPAELAWYIQKYSIEVVNSHAWWADKVAYQAVRDLPHVQWIISMHGHYELLEQQPSLDNEFGSLYRSMMQRVNHITYAADKNTSVVRAKSLDLLYKMHKINNGYAMQSIQPLKRNQITDDSNAFIFGLVSRAIVEKGWEESIQAIIRLNTELQQIHHLVLIGKSDYSAVLKQRYGQYKYIHFIEDFSKPNEWISWVQVFDVGLLPTYYAGESLPTAVVEYLAYGKPVISTHIGEIRHMLEHRDGRAAGILLELNNESKVSVPDLTAAIKTMVLNKAKFEEYKQNTKLMFDSFSMANCADSYFKLFERV